MPLSRRNSYHMHKERVNNQITKCNKCTAQAEWVEYSQVGSHEVESAMGEGTVAIPDFEVTGTWCDSHVPTPAPTETGSHVA